MKDDLAFVYVRLARTFPDLGAGLMQDTLHELQAIGRSLSRISLRFCEEDMPSEVEARVEKRQARLRLEAWDLGQKLHCDVYFQTDPRGGPIYLIPALDHETCMSGIDWIQRKHASDYNQVGIYLPC